MIQNPRILFCFAILFFTVKNNIIAQILTNEDSLAAGIEKKERNPTYIAGYGEGAIHFDLRLKTGTASLTRNVLFVGHKFSDKINLFSEWELEDTKISGGEVGGEMALEQMFIKFDCNPNNYFSVGLIIPRLGIINESHLPTTFYSNARPMVETLLIPSTWRELGIGYYGNSKKLAGLNYSLGLLNGLNSSGFSHGNAIREGRYEGRYASISSIALTGSLLYYIRNFRIQVSSYFGGSAGINKTQSDTLQLHNGAFGTPVSLSEANIQYERQNFSLRILGACLFIPDAFNINRAYTNNTPEKAIGGYLEMAYNFGPILGFKNNKKMIAFARTEILDLNNKVPANGIPNKEMEKLFIFTGINYKPLNGIIFKFDYMLSQSGPRNEALKNPGDENFYRIYRILNLGIGYSF